MKYALIDTNGIVRNIIQYDGIASYNPPFGFTLEQVNDWVNTGQATDVPEPSIISNVYYQAISAIDKADNTMLRISEAISLGLTTWTASDVVAFVEYRRALRQIISTKSGSMPVKPPYPAGT